MEGVLLSSCSAFLYARHVISTYWFIPCIHQNRPGSISRSFFMDFLCIYWRRLLPFLKVGSVAWWHHTCHNVMCCLVFRWDRSAERLVMEDCERPITFKDRCFNVIHRLAVKYRRACTEENVPRLERETKRFTVVVQKDAHVPYSSWQAGVDFEHSYLNKWEGYVLW